MILGDEFAYCGLEVNLILLMATRNPVNSPVEVGSEYPIFLRRHVLYIQVVSRMSDPSTVAPFT